jgi:hypothetical protein
MAIDRAFEESNLLAEELFALIDVPLFNNTPRIETADIACSLALEHWHSVRLLLQAGLLPSALVTHRAQFEAIVRSIWLTHSATDSEIAKLAARLDLDSEQAAKNISQINHMMEALSKSAPVQAYAALARFKDNSWKALNSYAHAGIHPIRRHADGYPTELIHSVLCNANGLAILCGMQAVVLGGLQPLQREILSLAAAHKSCMPPPL